MTARRAVKTHYTDFQGMTASADGLAQLFGVTRQTIYDWVKREGLIKGDRGKFELIASIKWMLERLTTKNALNITDISSARQRLVEGQAINVELKNRREAGDLVEFETMLETVTTVTSLCVNQLDQVESWANDEEQRAQFREQVADAKRIIEFRLREIASTHESGRSNSASD